MSTYEWERGTLTIPGGEWPKLKQAVRDAYNALEREHLALAERIYAQLAAQAKGKRGFDYRQAFRTLLDQQRSRSYARSDDRIDTWRIEQALFGGWDEKRTTPLQPKKKDFPEANGATRQFVLGEASIVFDEKARTVTWDVPENNHAVDRARAHPVAQALFYALDRVQWGSRGNSGGTLLGGNEYAREAARDYEGDGGSYATARYGPLGEKQDPVAAYLRRQRRTRPQPAAREYTRSHIRW